MAELLETLVLRGQDVTILMGDKVWVVPDEVRTLAWQPIETAPKDGTKVILYGPAMWAGGGDFGMDKGWYDKIGHSWVTDASSTPTHWMPMPDPPNASRPIPAKYPEE